MTLLERLNEAQQRDADEMKVMYEAIASGMPPDAAASAVIGGEYRLSDHVKEALIR